MRSVIERPSRRKSRHMVYIPKTLSGWRLRPAIVDSPAGFLPVTSTLSFSFWLAAVKSARQPGAQGLEATYYAIKMRIIRSFEVLCHAVSSLDRHEKHKITYSL